LTKLGVNQVFLALDSDTAGQEAIAKIGNLFQRDGIDVRVITMPPGADPDSYLRDYGPESFLQLLDQSTDYLTFLIQYESKKVNINSPAGKNELVKTISQKIIAWNQPLMVHESLKKVAQLLQVPDNMVGLDQIHTPNIYIKKTASIGLQNVNPDRVLETDFLRWLYLFGRERSEFLRWASHNISSDGLLDPMCRKFYQVYMKTHENGGPCDLATLANQIPEEEGQAWFQDLTQKKVNRDKAESQFTESIQKILERNWMLKREEIKMKIQAGNCSDDEALELVKQFEAIKQKPPKINLL
jgi:DNA primase